MRGEGAVDAVDTALARLPGGTLPADMRHRHLTHEAYSLAAIDDVIARGKRRDWAELRQAVLQDRTLMRKVLRVCAAHAHDPYAQRYHFWNHYAERHLG